MKAEIQRQIQGQKDNMRSEFLIDAAVGEKIQQGINKYKQLIKKKKKKEDQTRLAKEINRFQDLANERLSGDETSKIENLQK